jgi:hypothetical protein
MLQCKERAYRQNASAAKLQEAGKLAQFGGMADNIYL